MAHVLITDDDPFFRGLIRAFLTEANHTCRQAQDGLDCLKVLGQEAFDLLIVDMLMPRMDGIETIRKARVILPELKILAISGGGEHIPVEASLRMAGQLGADSYLMKPFGAPQLYGKLGELLAAENA